MWNIITYKKQKHFFILVYFNITFIPVVAKLNF